MSIEVAINDLADVLKSFDILDAVEDIRPMAGRPEFHLAINVGPHSRSEHYGLVKIRQELELQLTVKTAMSPSQISNIVAAIDTEIVRDRRRGGVAQTTILDDEGWTPEETEGGHVLNRIVEVVTHDHG